MTNSLKLVAVGQAQAYAQLTQYSAQYNVKHLAAKREHVNLKAHVTYPNSYSKYAYRRMTNVVLYVIRLPNCNTKSTVKVIILF